MSSSRNGFEIDEQHPLVSLVADQIKSVSGKAATLRAEPFWTDCTLIAEAGMTVVMYGPHAAEDWVDIKSLKRAASVNLDRHCPGFL